MSVCCFTGHRALSLAEQQQILPNLMSEIEKLINRGVTVFRNGGALGFDTLAAICVLGLRKKYPNVKLYIDVPHKGQDARWNEMQQNVYAYILKSADKVTYLSEEYYSGCMQARNRHMVDRSDYVLAYIRRTSGGSYYTAAYAEAQDKTVVYL